MKTVIERMASLFDKNLSAFSRGQARHATLIWALVLAACLSVIWHAAQWDAVEVSLEGSGQAVQYLYHTGQGWSRAERDGAHGRRFFLPVVAREFPIKGLQIAFDDFASSCSFQSITFIYHGRRIASWAGEEVKGVMRLPNGNRGVFRDGVVVFELPSDLNRRWVEIAPEALEKVAASVRDIASRSPNGTKENALWQCIRFAALWLLCAWFWTKWAARLQASQTVIKVRLVTVLLLWIVLFYPALLNGAPIIHGDSCRYLPTAFNFEEWSDAPCIIMRFLWRPAGMLFGPLGAIGAQALFCAYSFALLHGYLDRGRRSLVIAFVCLFSGASHYASMAMMDIYTSTGFAALFLMLQGCKNRSLPVILGLSACAHLTNIAVFAFVLIAYVALVVLQHRRGICMHLDKRQAVLAAAAILVAGCLVRADITLITRKSETAVFTPVFSLGDNVFQWAERDTFLGYCAAYPSSFLAQNKEILLPFIPEQYQPPSWPMYYPWSPSPDVVKLALWSHSEELSAYMMHAIRTAPLKIAKNYSSALLDFLFRPGLARDTALGQNAAIFHRAVYYSTFSIPQQKQLAERVVLQRTNKLTRITPISAISLLYYPFLCVPVLASISFLLGKRRANRLLDFSAFSVLMLIANTGLFTSFSGNCGRYQLRSLPLLAFATVLLIYYTISSFRARKRGAL